MEQEIQRRLREAQEWFNRATLEGWDASKRFTVEALLETVKEMAERQEIHLGSCERVTVYCSQMGEIITQVSERMVKLEEDQATLTASAARRIVALEARVDRLEEAEDGELDCGGKEGKNA